MKKIRSLLVLGAFLFSSLNLGHAQTFKVLHSFGGAPDGGLAVAGVTIDNGILYGGTYEGGRSNNGTIFLMAPNGSNYVTLQSFAGPNDGANEYCTPLVTNGVIYATTVFGGTNGLGTLVSISTNGGAFTVLHTFGLGLDGSQPAGGLLLSGGTIYGTTVQGGSNAAGGTTSGTFYSISTNGSNYKVLHNFNGDTNGYNPYYCQLVISGNTIYGTTIGGGPGYGDGTVFSIGTNGSNYTVVHGFSDTDGSAPRSGLILVNDTLYGTTLDGGNTNGQGTIFSVKTNGTQFSTLHTFGPLPDGISPEGALVLGDKKLYGTTTYGGIQDSGTIFSINLDGTGYTNFYSFSATTTNSINVETNSDGFAPIGQLFFDNGILFGTTSGGGPTGFGNVFSFNLHPAFFNGEVALGNDVYYLAFTNGNLFGYYSYDIFPYLYHFDLGFEYFFSNTDSQNGAYLYDFTSGHFWYTTPAVFPYIYDFSLNAWIYYYRDTSTPDRYTSNPRYFYNFGANAIITQ